MKITLQDTAAIKDLSLEVPDDGGVLVLRGANGIGKSTTLQAIDALIGGTKPPSARHGAAVGYVEGFGVSMRLGRAVTRKGELEVQSLEGKFSLADLVDPGLKDQSKGDAIRIKSLVQIGCNDFDPTRWNELLNGVAFDISTLSALDVVNQAGAVKRAIEAEARNKETKADEYKTKATACLSYENRIDPEQVEKEYNEERLRKSNRDAISSLNDIERRIAEEKKVKAHISDLEKVLQTAQDKQLSKEEFEQQRAELIRRGEAIELQVSEIERIKKEMIRLEKKLNEDRLHLQAMSAAQREQNRLLTEQEEIVATISTTKARIKELSAQPTTTTAALDEARSRVASTEVEMEKGVLLRQQAKDQKEGDSYRQLGIKAQKMADELRERAKRTDDILTELIQTLKGPLSVRGGRLVATNARGLEVPFAELSEGERWKIALNYGIQAVGKKGCLVVPQTAWEGLDPSNKALVVETLRGTGVVLITAQATDDKEITQQVLK